MELTLNFNHLNRREQIIAFMHLADLGFMEKYPDTLEKEYHHNDYYITIEAGNEVFVHKKL